MEWEADSSQYIVEMDELDDELCWWLVARTRFGRVAFVADGEPGVLPVNCGVVDRQVVFRTGTKTTLGAMAGGTPVAFETDHIDPVAESGWSVVVKGQLWPVADDDELARAAEFELHPWAPGVKDRWMKIVPTAVTGREVTRHRDLLSARARP